MGRIDDLELKHLQELRRDIEANEQKILEAEQRQLRMTGAEQGFVYYLSQKYDLPAGAMIDRNTGEIVYPEG